MPSGSRSSGWWEEPAGLALGGFFAGLGHGISFPVILAIATTRAAVGDRGTVTATFTAVFDLVLFAIAPLLGLVIAIFGYPAMFLTVSGAVIGGIAVFYLLRPATNQDLVNYSRTSDRPSPAWVNAADPLNRSQKAAGAWSKPSTTCSVNLSFPSRIHPAISATAGRKSVR